MAEPRQEIVVCRDLGDLSQRTASAIVRLAGESTGQGRPFTIALSGGSTPKGVYAALAGPPYRDRLPWERIFLFWGDERCVAPDSSESNYRMADEAMISKVSIPKGNVYRMRGEESPQEAARRYERELRDFFSLARNEFPRFDLILLGLGEEGHTASLFPESEAVLERQRLVSAPYVEKLDAHRLTLTLPVINQAANIFFLVAGKSKAAVLWDVLRGKRELPAALVKPVNGRVVWFVDEEAGRFIE